MNLIDRFIRVKIPRGELFVLGVLLTFTVQSQEYGLDAAARAYSERDWPSVIELLGTSPTSIENKRLLGLAYFHQQNLDQALPLLQQVALNNPDDSEVVRVLLESSFVRQDYAIAKKVLSQRSNQNDDLSIYAARIAVAEGDSESADAIFGTLLQSSDSSVAQDAAADYIDYLQQQRRYEKAYSVALAAIERDPDSFLSYRFRQINKVLDQPKENPWRFNFGYRFEYDDNVALLPDALSPTGDQDDSDFRHVATADVIYQKRLGGHWLLFAEGRGSQSIHHQSSEFDFTGLNALLGTGQAYDDWGWRLPVEISHDRFDGDSFSTTFTTSPGVYFKVAKKLYTHLYGRLANSDFDQVAFPEDDRSADIYGGGLLLTGNITQRWTVRSIVEYLDYSADGSNWDRQEAQAYFYTEYGLSRAWSVGAGARYTDIEFDNINLPFLVQRDDESVEYFLSSTYQVAQGWYMRAQLTFVDNQSNIEVFDYQRLVTSLGLSWQF